MDNLTKGQKLALGGGALLLISSFLPWYSVFGISINAWSSGFLAWGGVILGVAAAVVIALKAFGKNEVAAGGMATEQIALILAGISFVLILLRFLTQTSLVSFGLFLGLIAAALTAFGCYTAGQERGLDLPGRSTHPRDPGATPPSV